MPRDLSRQAPVASNVPSKSLFSPMRASCHGRSQNKLHPHLLKGLDLLPNDSPRQPIAGYGVSQHATGFAQGIEHRHRVAGLAQVVGSREPGGTGAHHGHALVRRHIRDGKNVDTSPRMRSPT